MIEAVNFIQDATHRIKIFDTREGKSLKQKKREDSQLLLGGKLRFFKRKARWILMIAIKIHFPHSKTARTRYRKSHRPVKIKIRQRVTIKKFCRWQRQVGKTRSIFDYMHISFSKVFFCQRLQKLDGTNNVMT